MKDKPILLNQFVQTPTKITEVLLENEKFYGDILEPCCGKGAISECLKKAGYSVTSSDKFEYEYGDVMDLFAIQERYTSIITNPPFIQQSLVKKHLFSITRHKLALLWYVKNIGNEIEAPTGRHLKAIYVFNKRIDWVETKLGWKFAWYVWDKDFEGDIIIKKIDLPSNKLF